MDTIAYASNFSSTLSLWLAIVIGIVASSLVWRAALKMGGGLFGAVLKLFAAGMFMVAFGSVFLAVQPWFDAGLMNLAHTVFFSSGFVCMVLGANKLLKGIMS